MGYQEQHLWQSRQSFQSVPRGPPAQSCTSSDRNSLSYRQHIPLVASSPVTQKGLHLSEAYLPLVFTCQFWGSLHCTTLPWKGATWVWGHHTDRVLLPIALCSERDPPTADVPYGQVPASMWHVETVCECVRNAVQFSIRHCQTQGDW